MKRIYIVGERARMVELRELSRLVDSIPGLSSMSETFEILDTEALKTLASSADAFLLYFSPYRSLRTSFFEFELSMVGDMISENPKPLHPSLFVLGTVENFPYEAHWVRHVSVDNLHEILNALNVDSSTVSGVIVDDDDGYID